MIERSRLRSDAEDRDGRNDGDDRDGDPGHGLQREFHERIGGDETESEKRDPEAGSERDARKRRCADEKRARHPACRHEEERRREAGGDGAQRPAAREAGGECESQEGQRRKRRTGGLGPLPHPVTGAAQDAVRLKVGKSGRAASAKRMAMATVPLRPNEGVRAARR